MRIGILTGGGDVPGLNPCIKAVVDRIVDHGHDAVGILRGWSGLLQFDLDDPGRSNERCVRHLDPRLVRNLDRTGGTFLRTSRLNPQRLRPEEVPRFLAEEAIGGGPFDLTAHVLRVVEALELDALVPIGGDDTLSYALRLNNEGVPVVAIPKTMDNDVHGTDYCVGFSTAVTRSVEFIQQLRASTSAHERIAVVELFGRYSGETSLVSAYLANVDRAIISEVPFDPERLAALLMEDKRRNPANYSMVTVSEGATYRQPYPADRTGPRPEARMGGVGAATGELIRELTGQEIISQNLGYLMRSGSPDSLDLMVATNFAVMAADLAVRDEGGRMVAVRSGTYTNVPLDVTGEGAKRVDVDALYDREAYRPKVREVAGKPMFLS